MTVLHGNSHNPCDTGTLKRHLAITCFRYVGDLDFEEEITALNKALMPALENDGRIFITPTKLNGQQAPSEPASSITVKMKQSQII